MRFIKVLLLLVIFFFGLLFFVQNSTALSPDLDLQLNLFFLPAWKGLKLPFYFVVLLGFAVGMIFATALLFIDRVRLGCALMGKKRAERALKRQVEMLQDKLAKETRAIESAAARAKEARAIEGMARGEAESAENAAKAG